MKNPCRKKKHFPSFFAGPGPWPGPGPPRAQAQGLRRRMENSNKRLENPRKNSEKMKEKLPFWAFYIGNPIRSCSAAWDPGFVGERQARWQLHRGPWLCHPSTPTLLVALVTSKKHPKHRLAHKRHFFAYFLYFLYIFGR